MSPIMIKEGDAKRKISKRKDPEAAVKYYHEQGYPAVAVTEYLLNIANSPFENWRRSNPTEPNENFPIELDRMSVSGALFDINKLRDISRDLIAAMTAEQVYDFALAWAEEYDTQIAELLRKNADYAKTIFDIERNKEKPRKDIEKWLDVRETITYFYDELFDDEKDKPYEMPDNISKEDIKNILVGYQSIYESEDEKPQWFERIRSLSEELGFAKEMKSYKAAPESFKGHVGDVSTIIRVALTKRRNTPDLYEIMRTIGKEKVIQRIEECVKGIH
jgi:glutamyl-tRNA synthetase